MPAADALQADLFNLKVRKNSPACELVSSRRRLILRMKKTFLPTVVLLGAATASQAGIHIGFGFNIPLGASAPAPVYQAPAPVYTTPLPVVYQAPVRVVAPAPTLACAPPVTYAPLVVCAPPVVYAPAPAVYLGFGPGCYGHPAYYGHYHGAYYHGHGWHR
jgi:hypothetical protein